MKTTVFLTWTLAVSVLCAADVDAPGEDKTISVCDLLRDLAKYRGKTVVVRGELRTGRHQVALFGDDCQHKLETDGHVWLSAIWLTEAKGGMEGDRRGVDQEAIRRVNDTVRRERQRGNVGRVFVTFVGRLETRERFYGAQGHGRWIGNGYGHMNAYPAQLVIRSAKDARVLE